MRNLSFRKPTQPVDESVLSNFEEVIGSRLPDGYRQFITATNGGMPDRTNNYFHLQNNMEGFEGLNKVEVDIFYRLKCEEHKCLELIENYECYKGRIPQEMVAIASDPFGNQLLLGFRPPLRNMVFFWDHECEGFEPSLDAYHNVGKLADSFEEFVDSLKPGK